MKKARYTLFLIALALLVPTSTGVILAAPTQTVTKPLPVEQSPAQKTPLSPEQTVSDITLPLAIRRDTVVLQLRDLTTRFSTYAARTQLAIDRLTEKGITTGDAQDELLLTTTSLSTAKSTTDTLATIVVSQENDIAATAEIKSSVIKIQESIKDARAHLINALTAVKLAVTTTLDTDSQ